MKYNFGYFPLLSTVSAHLIVKSADIETVNNEGQLQIMEDQMVFNQILFLHDFKQTMNETFLMR